MSDVRRCAQCGALPSKNSARFCEYCGTELPAPAALARPLDPNSREALELLFARLADHPSTPELLKREPSAAGVHMGLGCLSVFALAFMGVAIFMGVGALKMGAGFMAIVPFGMGVAGFFMLVGSARKQARLASAPLERTPVRIMDERTAHSDRSTTYYATLQTEDGSRFEVPIDAKTAAQIATGDMGIAYLKGGLMIGFERVPV